MDCLLRAATATDVTLLYEWRNDPTTRANSRETEPIPWETHCAWLRRKLEAADARLWILECDKEPVGQIRYERCDSHAEISFSIGAGFRGRGLAKQMLVLSAPQACRDLRVERLSAIVRTDNVPSARAFEAANFIRVHQAEGAYAHFEWLCQPGPPLPRSAVAKPRGGPRMPTSHH